MFKRLSYLFLFIFEFCLVSRVRNKKNCYKKFVLFFKSVIFFKYCRSYLLFYFIFIFRYLVDNEFCVLVLDYFRFLFFLYCYLVFDYVLIF